MTEAPDEDEVQMKVIWEADLVQEVLEVLNSIVNEARIQFLDGLIRIWVVDSANVCGVFIDLKPEEHEQIQHYAVDPEGLVMGVNTVKLADVMDHADPDVPIQVEFGAKHKFRFHISMPGVDVDLAGIDEETVRDDPDHPRLSEKLSAGYVLDGSDIRDAVELNDMFASTTSLVVDNHQVRFVADGDTDSAKYCLDEADGEVDFTQHPEDRQESMFSLDYLKSLRMVLKDHDEIQVYSDTDMPVMMKTGLFDMMLAPRIDSSK